MEPQIHLVITARDPGRAGQLSKAGVHDVLRRIRISDFSPRSLPDAVLQQLASLDESVLLKAALRHFRQRGQIVRNNLSL